MKLARTKFRQIWGLPLSHCDRSLEAGTASTFGPPVVTLYVAIGGHFLFLKLPK